MVKSCTIVWFRRDLRVEDNPALSLAARMGKVVPVFIWSPEEEGQFRPGRASRWWLKQSLIQLDASLTSLGASLVLRRANDSLSALLDLVRETGATHVLYNHLYDPVSLVRDHDVKSNLMKQGIQIQSLNSDLLYEPWQIQDQNGQPFRVFEDFWQKCVALPHDPEAPLLPPRRLIPFESNVSSYALEELGLEDNAEKSSNALLARAWLPGWTNGDKALESFLASTLHMYAKNRHKIDGSMTSLLSPHLHFGEVSIRKVFHMVRGKQLTWRKESSSEGEESVNQFLRSIGLREYSRYLCFNFPFTHERSLLSNMKSFPWRGDESLFKVWRQGRTGYPLVDAGMRQLWATGWLHNRVRVICASFCVKFLQLPWMWGMKYFWDTLLDADLESDVLGWQYVSGSLPDSHELDRMDNPEVEGNKFDAEGEYVRQWLPELARMPAEWIHHPWDAPPVVLCAAGVELGCNYPRPIVEFTAAQHRLFQAITQMNHELVNTKRVAEEGHGENDGPSTRVSNTSEAVRISRGIYTPTLQEDQDMPPVVANLYCDQMVPSVPRISSSQTTIMDPQPVSSFAVPCAAQPSKQNQPQSQNFIPELLPSYLHSSAESSSSHQQIHAKNETPSHLQSKEEPGQSILPYLDNRGLDLTLAQETSRHSAINYAEKEENPWCRQSKRKAREDS